MVSVGWPLITPDSWRLSG